MLTELRKARLASDVHERRLNAERISFLKARLAQKRASHRGKLLNPVMYERAPFTIMLEAAE